MYLLKNYRDSDHQCLDDDQQRNQQSAGFRSRQRSSWPDLHQRRSSSSPPAGRSDCSEWRWQLHLGLRLRYRSKLARYAKHGDPRAKHLDDRSRGPDPYRDGAADEEATSYCSNFKRHLFADLYPIVGVTTSTPCDSRAGCLLPARQRHAEWC